MNEQKVGWVWVPGDRGKFRPFTEFRQIQKGKHRGMVEVTLPATKARKVLVEPGAIRSYPVAPLPFARETEEKDQAE